MKHSDKDLGMDRAISRRDIVHGFGAIGAGLVMPGSLAGCSEPPIDAASYYPPALTGMRGNHDGSFAAAHALSLEDQSEWGTVREPDVDIYDLVVVGGGISGLAAAHFYRKEKPDARILILDNHDDFGGHAKRTEFQVGDRTLICHGGSETLTNPSKYSDIVKGLLNELGVDIQRFYTAYDQDFFKRHGLKSVTHFNKEKWGVDRIVSTSFGAWGISDTETSLSSEQAVAQIPISEAAQREFLRLLTLKDDQIPEMPVDEKWRYLSTISYQDFLTKHIGITEPEVLTLLQSFTGDLGLGIEDITAERALNYVGMPGRGATGLPLPDDEEPYIHHFPDGNASIARLLVRLMIPDVAPGNTMEDIVTARFDYSKLDRNGAPVRIRLNSTVTKVEHDGDPQSANRVHVTYVTDGQAYRVKGYGCVLACYNSIIPYLCPELPEAQREALAFQVKQPLLYTNVALRNWQPWKKLGIGEVNSPGSYHRNVSLTYPVSLGDYTYSTGPDEPVMAMMYRSQAFEDRDGLTPQEQFRAARYELLATPFEEIERHVRSQLLSILGEGGFDPATDIMGITVNRWAHGYSYWYNPLYDGIYDDYRGGSGNLHS